jgi:hypothetical protein
MNCLDVAVASGSAPDSRFDAGATRSRKLGAISSLRSVSTEHGGWGGAPFPSGAWVYCSRGSEPPSSIGGAHIAIATRSRSRIKKMTMVVQNSDLAVGTEVRSHRFHPVNSTIMNGSPTWMGCLSNLGIVSDEYA